jgi:hypothetical protein
MPTWEFPPVCWSEYQISAAIKRLYRRSPVELAHTMLQMTGWIQALVSCWVYRCHFCKLIKKIIIVSIAYSSIA